MSNLRETISHCQKWVSKNLFISSIFMFLFRETFSFFFLFICSFFLSLGVIFFFYISLWATLNIYIYVRNALINWGRMSRKTSIEEWKRSFLDKKMYFTTNFIFFSPVFYIANCRKYHIGIYFQNTIHTLKITISNEFICRKCDLCHLKTCTHNVKSFAIFFVQDVYMFTLSLSRLFLLLHFEI